MLMKGPRKRMTFTLSKAFHPPPVGPPPYADVINALRSPPAKRTEEETQILFRYLLLNSKLLKMLENTDRIKEAAKSATLVTMHRGEVLCFEGDDPDGWFLVLDGTVDVIIRLFLVAEDCSFDAQEHETTEFAQLMDLMELDMAIDKLKRVNVLKPGQIFGHHSYLLERQRMSTIVASADYVDLIRFEPEIFQKTSSLILAKNLYSEHKQLTHNVFPRLRDDQLTMISALADTVELKAGTTITADSEIGNNLYIVKSGTIARYRVIDFTDLSFRKIDAAFERLELHFPDGMHPVHTDDLTAGTLFADPSVKEMSDSQFNVKTTTDVELLALDLEYFRIVVGAFEVERVRQEIKSELTDAEVIRIWVEAEKKKLWSKFKEREIKDAHRQMKTEKQFRTSTLAIRVPKVPKALKSYKPKKVVPYAPKSLRG